MSEGARDPGEERFERRARELFGASAGALDARTAARLARARAAAVAALESRRRPAWPRAVPLAAAASAVLVAVLLTRAPGDPPAPVAAADDPAGIDAFDLIGADEDLELAADDPDFYAWLEYAVLDDPAGRG